MKPAISKDLFDLQDSRWLLHCAEGPTPVAVAEAARAYLDLEVHVWDRQIGRDVVDVLENARRQAAAVISGTPGIIAAPEDISLSQSTSSALTLVARSFPFRPGDEILAPAGEFPSNVWPWKALADRGVTFREVPLWEGHTSGRDCLLTRPPSVDACPERTLAAAIGPNTRMITASWVRFQDGLMLDLGLLGRLCAERGIPLVVDGIQGAGTHVPDLTNVSAFATGGHKGLLAMSGQGFLWTSPEFRAGLSPIGSWLSVEEGGNFNRPVTDLDRGWLTTGQRLEQGGYNVLGALVLGGSVGVINSAGTAAIGPHVRALQAALVDGLLARAATSGQSGASGPFATPGGLSELHRLKDLVAAGRTGPILSIHHHGRGPDFPADLAALMQKSGIFVSTREGYLRIAFHAWHDEGDVRAVIDALD